MTEAGNHASSKDATAIRATSLHALLRTAARAAHRRIDRHPMLLPLVRPGLTRAHYEQVLRIFLNLHQTLQPAISAEINRLHAEYELSDRIDWLLSDLASLAGQDNAAAEPATDIAWSLPLIYSAPALTGALYVIEGSALGSRIIRHLHASLGIDANPGARFFHAWAMQPIKIGIATGGLPPHCARRNIMRMPQQPPWRYSMPSSEVWIRPGNDGVLRKIHRIPRMEQDKKHRMNSDHHALLTEALNRCATEPIHLAGAIQDHGILLAFDEAGILRMASGNLPTVFGQTTKEVLERPIAGLIGADTLTRLRACLSEAGLERTAPVRFSVTNNAREIKLTAIAHRTGLLNIVELEEEISEKIELTNSILPVISQRLTHLDRHDDIVSFCQAVTEELRALTGFDRVKIYRFDRLWNGEIIAESRNNILPSFLHHHFPASDIPPQARALYEKNLIRFLADTHASSIPIIPALNPLTGQPLDLSLAALRAVSPVHIEYLHNMGVRSTITLSLINRARAQVMDTVRQQLQHLTGLIRHTHDVTALIREYPSEFLNLASATGSYFAFDNNSYTIGIAPPQEELPALIGWIKQQPLTHGIFATDKRITTDELGPRLDPRRSFALWLATVRRFSKPWSDTDIDAIKLFSFSLVQLLIQQAQRQADLADSANRAKSEFISPV
jgi:heme oxygenase